MRFLARMGLNEIYSFEKGIIRTFVFLIFMALILRADQMVMSPVIPFIQKEFAIGDKEIGFVGSAFTLVAAVVTLIWGYLSDKYPRKLLLISAILIGEIPCLLTAFATNYTQLLVLRVLTGIGIGAMVPIAFSILGDLFTEKQRPRAQAWYQMMGGMGVLVGMVVAGFVGPTYGWRLPFIIVSVPNFFFALTLLVGGKEPKRGAGEAALKELILGGKNYTRTMKLQDYLHLFKVPSNIWLFLQGIPGTVAWGVLPYFLITFYVRFKNLSVELATILLLIIGMGMIFGNLFGGIMGNWIYTKNRSYLPIFCGISQFLGVIPLIISLNWPAAPEPSFSYILFPALLGFLGAIFISSAGPNVLAMLANVNLPEHRGGISSIFNLTDSIGAGFGPMIGGLLSAYKGLDYAMHTSVLFWIPCGILFFILIFTLNKDVLRVNTLMENTRKELEQINDLSQP
ncbi:MAG: Bacillibactin exporter [candidate division WS2 bacterium]|nr:Bacillibactin exporter [Candidatus Lithacetigena glycinireducens]